MHYKTIVKYIISRKIYSQIFQRPYPFNTKANLNRKSFHRLHILIFSFKTCVCAWLKIADFQQNKNSMLQCLINEIYIDSHVDLSMREL